MFVTLVCLVSAVYYDLSKQCVVDVMFCDLEIMYVSLFFLKQCVRSLATFRIIV